MKNAHKTALLSGLVFPGLGQVVLKHRRIGAALILTTILSMSTIVVIAVRRALVVLDRIAAGGGTMDMNTITNAATQASTPSGSAVMQAAIALIALCWIFGIVHGFLAGRKVDQAAEDPAHLNGTVH